MVSLFALQHHIKAAEEESIAILFLIDGIVLQPSTEGHYLQAKRLVCIYTCHLVFTRVFINIHEQIRKSIYRVLRHGVGEWWQRSYKWERANNDGIILCTNKQTKIERER